MRRKFFICHLIDTDGGRLASEEVWSPDADMMAARPDYDLDRDFTAERCVLDAASFFSTDDHGEDPAGCTIRMFGPFEHDDEKPSAVFAIGDNEDPSVNEFFTAARV